MEKQSGNSRGKDEVDREESIETVSSMYIDTRRRYLTATVEEEKKNYTLFSLCYYYSYSYFIHRPLSIYLSHNLSIYLYPIYLS